MTADRRLSSSKSSIKTLQKPHEDLDSVPIAFSMVFNLHGVARTAFGAKVAKRVEKDLVV
jgi:hypothetical protein